MDIIVPAYSIVNINSAQLGDYEMVDIWSFVIGGGLIWLFNIAAIIFGIGILLSRYVMGDKFETKKDRFQIALAIITIIGLGYIVFAILSPDITKDSLAITGLVVAILTILTSSWKDTGINTRLDRIERCLKDRLPAAEPSDEPHEKNKIIPVIFGRELTDEDKIIFEHLSKRHEDLLSFADALDSKLAQIIALNGLILSFVFYRGNEAAIPPVFIFGLVVIVISIIIGVYGYYSKKYSAGLSSNFFRDYAGFDSGKGLSILYDRLIKGIEKNTETQVIKGRCFNYMLILNVVGLIILMVGYYA